MPFDLVTADEHGNRTGHVQFDPDEHYQLMQMAKNLNFSLILHMFDYYEEVNFRVDELDILENELKLLLFHAKQMYDKKIFTRISEFLKLVTFAKEQKTDVLGLPD